RLDGTAADAAAHQLLVRELDARLADTIVQLVPQGRQVLVVFLVHRAHEAEDVRQQLAFEVLALRLDDHAYAGKVRQLFAQREGRLRRQVLLDYGRCKRVVRIETLVDRRQDLA